MEPQPMAEYAIAVHSLNGGIQEIYSFPNGYGASVVRHQYSYGGLKGLWELAVIENIVYSEKPEDIDFDITYDTPITEDVLGWLDRPKVYEILEQIKALSVS